MPAQAYAGQLGTIITNVVAAADNMVWLISLFAYIGGALLCVIGIFKFKDHVDQPLHHPLSAGVKRFVAGGMLLSLPWMGRAVRGNLLGGGTALGATSPAVTSQLGAPLGPANAVDGMIVNVMLDISAPMDLLFSLFCYIAGGIILVVGILRLTKRMDDGPRGPAGFGTIMCFITSGALFGLGDMAGVFLNSLFGNTNIMTAPVIGLNLGLTAADQNRLNQVIQALMYFVGLVGMLAFIRGWFVLRAFADGGRQDATLAQGLTFLFGGALAINLGGVVNAIQNTLGNAVPSIAFN
ncbi:MAG: hypothetical protein OXT65_02155 [Alphaproteobacteria bacterium]|nr:hypothetical protein [Alphaproteobacteria bacterium]